jgi:hypothetical protein
LAARKEDNNLAGQRTAARLSVVPLARLTVFQADN